jgi:hypothetical protein
MAAALAVGAALRFWNLRDQVLGGDELHLVRAVLGGDLLQLLTTFRHSDASIPLCALFRLLVGAGLPMSEAALRTPSLLAGLGLVALAPWLLVRCGPPGITRLAPPALFAAILALAPPLVLYSRIVRSYSVVILLCTVAAAAFYAFWTRGSRRAGALYVASGAAALWFHLGAGPCLVAPLLFAAADWLAGGRRRELRPLLFAAIGLAAASALLIGPAATSLADLIAAKRAPFEMSAATLAATAGLQAGAGNPWVAAVWWLLAAAGWFRLRREAPRFAMFSAVVVAGQLAGLALLSPMTIDNAIVLNRYLLPVTPWLLLWVAVGLRGLGRVAPAAALAAWFLAGPLPEPRFRHSVFAHHNRAMLYTQPWEVEPAALPELYRRLVANLRPDERIALHPFNDRWYRFERIPLLQTGYRRPVVVVGHQGYLARPEVRLRNAVYARIKDLLDTDARYLVSHLTPNEVPGSQGDRQFLRELERAWGPPEWREESAAESIYAWDLEAVRRSAAAAQVPEAAQDGAILRARVIGGFGQRPLGGTVEGAEQGAQAGNRFGAVGPRRQVFELERIRRQVVQPQATLAPIVDQLQIAAHHGP